MDQRARPSSNAITALAQDSRGTIWVATLAGLAQFDGVRFLVHDAAAHPRLTLDRFTTMKRTPDDALWLSNEQYDLFRFAGGSFEHIDQASVLSVTQSPQGWLAYGTTRGIVLIGPQGRHWLTGEIANERVLELDWPDADTLLALTDRRLIEIAGPLTVPTVRRVLALPGPHSGALMRRADGRVLIGRQTLGNDDPAIPQFEMPWTKPFSRLREKVAAGCVDARNTRQGRSFPSPWSSPASGRGDQTGIPPTIRSNTAGDCRAAMILLSRKSRHEDSGHRQRRASGRGADAQSQAVRKGCHWARCGGVGMDRCRRLHCRS